MREVTDPNILAQLNGTVGGMREVTDPNLLAQLNAQPEPQEEMGTLEGLGRGYLKGGKDVVMGTLQAGTDIAARAFPESEGIRSFRELLPEAQERSRRGYEAQVGDSTAADIGEFAGEVAPFVAGIPAAATVAGAIGIGAAGGAVAGATAPTEEALTPDEALAERGTGAAIGGTIGAAIPGGVAAAKAITPSLKRGIENTAVKLTGINPQAAKDFVSEGIQQSLAAISDRPSIKLLDRWLSKFVGGAGVLQKNTNKTLDDIQQIIDKGTTKAVTPQQAGESIKAGAERYTERFHKTSSRLYGRLDKHLPGETKVSIESARQALTKELEGLPSQLQQRTASNEGIRILQDITEDATDGTIAYTNLKRYRTILGQKLSKPHLLGGEDEAILNKAYGAISEDMGLAATKQGPKAERAFKRANAFYKRGAANIQKNLQRVIGKDAPEQVYQAAIVGTKLGGTKINAIMNSLSPSQKTIVRETVIKNLGKAKAGAQDATGEVFSPKTFLTEWNKVSPEAKTALFDKKTRASLDKLARINSRITDIDRLANPSGTSQQLSVGALLAAAYYQPSLAVGAVIGAGATSRLMTNQKFINWLANASTKATTPKTLGQQLRKLSKIAQENPSISEDIAKYLGVIGALTNREE